MISCPLCGYCGTPHEEHRTIKTLQSCPRCGVLIKSLPPQTNAQSKDLQAFLEALQNAA